MSETAAGEGPAGKPRFWRTERWQKFVREVGSVVLGVLIALGLGAVAGEIGWKIEVANARNAMEVELGELIGQGEERDHIHACIATRLDQLSMLVDTAERTGKLPPLGEIGIPPWRTWPRGIWASTLSAQTAAHFDRDLLDNYSSAYEFADAMAGILPREVDAWTTLYALVGPGRSLTQGEAAQLRGAIAQARMLDRMMTGNGLRLKQIVIAYDLGYDPGSADAYGKRAAKLYPICDPIGANPPPSYGQAPFGTMIDTIKANPLTARNGSGLSQR